MVATLVWGVHRPSGEVRYIAQVPKGLACECICAGCGSELEAVNPQNPYAQRQMHFRHHRDTERAECHRATGLAAIKQVLRPGQRLVLPAFTVEADRDGGGGFMDSASQTVAESDVIIGGVRWIDEHTAALTLVDGSSLEFVVLADALPQSPLNVPASAAAELQLLVDPATLAELSLEGLRDGFLLNAGCKRWLRHWQQQNLHVAVQAELDRRENERSRRSASPSNEGGANDRQAAVPSTSSSPGNWRCLVWRASRVVAESAREQARQTAAASSGVAPVALMEAFESAVEARACGEAIHRWLIAIRNDRGEAFVAALAPVLLSGGVALATMSPHRDLL